MSGGNTRRGRLPIAPTIHFFTGRDRRGEGSDEIKKCLPGKVVYLFFSKGEDINIRMDKFPSFGGVGGGCPIPFSVKRAIANRPYNTFFLSGALPCGRVKTN